MALVSGQNNLTPLIIGIIVVSVLGLVVLTVLIVKIQKQKVSSHTL